MRITEIGIPNRYGNAAASDIGKQLNLVGSQEHRGSREDSENLETRKTQTMLTIAAEIAVSRFLFMSPVYI
ncbi:hypothetical protein A3C19_03705 [Candidatus Kaiserbacteria bacterium RIFCSPHIGHO2_02_FULL_54_22]|uniref:Uncharacterized protein n=1 Tax=Candidatus Kaiserbacteria bacterium RIFCSPHIGHO2_02_FULL_54_22 TaxID=1798495 RepID=A0A1F6DMZ7_9BACT|nr:MAG: hypothetical protein A3C19_03705 [Candidatus Kaiserbacteria bacterium RIFCSPHIGHO2_02_FULL_54_22]OGG68607.1 MAG: hypothetical protein A3E99_01045 [Candidatus Kaiserbacteria bacterium RIFCSPHIGHO2_12_FULL_54_16]